MAYYYKIPDHENDNSNIYSKSIVVHNEISTEKPGEFDFSKYILIELLDDVTPESEIWESLGLLNNSSVVHKRLMVDSHRLNCRRAVVVCTNSEKAKDLASNLTQKKVGRRSICAVVVQELLSDLRLFEKQILKHGDRRPQHQLVFVTDLSRRSEPSSLARYLKEKFSPFGKILSVMVSQDQNGFAFPEGVIRFAFLSEAFAAEIAYDQNVVGMERLSVTTHHNILLSQCDLRIRLRAAQLRLSGESYCDTLSPEMSYSRIEPRHIDCDNKENEFNGFSSVSDSNARNIPVVMEDGTMKKMKVVKSDLLSSSKSVKLLPDDSSEVSDVLRNPCPSNFIDCLKGMTVGSESSASKITQHSHSVARSVKEGSSCASQRRSASDFSPPSCKEMWPSRLLGWISDLPDGIADVDGNISSPVSFENECSFDKEDDVSSGITTNSKKVTSDLASTADSFVTCEDNEIASDSSSALSPENTVKNNSKCSVAVGSSLDSEFASVQSCPNVRSTDERDEIEKMRSLCVDFNQSESSALSNNDANDLSSYSSSQKRKVHTSLSQKLSLKNKRTNCSQPNRVFHHPINVSHPKKLCTNPMPQKNIIVNSTDCKMQETPDSNFQNCTVSNNVLTNAIVDCKPVTQVLKNLILDKKRCKNSDFCSMSAYSAKSVINQDQSLPRGHKLAPRNSHSFNCFSEFNSTSDAENKISPLRAWLKKELTTSTNNPVTEGQKNSKNIVCATITKDVMMSVGCSHMTCEFCYPETTNLLLGFH